MRRQSTRFLYILSFKKLFCGRRCASSTKYYPVMPHFRIFRLAQLVTLSIWSPSSIDGSLNFTLGFHGRLGRTLRIKNPVYDTSFPVDWEHRRCSQLMPTQCRQLGRRACRERISQCWLGTRTFAPSPNICPTEIYKRHTIRYDTRCYFNVRSKADISQLNLPHGNDN